MADTGTVHLDETFAGLELAGLLDGVVVLDGELTATLGDDGGLLGLWDLNHCRSSEASRRGSETSVKGKAEGKIVCCEALWVKNCEILEDQLAASRIGFYRVGDEWDHEEVGGLRELGKERVRRGVGDGNVYDQSISPYCSQLMFRARDLQPGQGPEPRLLAAHDFSSQFARRNELFRAQLVFRDEASGDRPRQQERN